MPGHDIIVIGASAGGVEALSQLVRQLPADLPAAIFVVLHVPAHGTSLLPASSTRNGPLPARHPADGEAIQPGRIYIAPPDSTCCWTAAGSGWSAGPRENGHRPAVDPLFRTAARGYGRRVVGVVLSGSLDDGTAGLAADQAAAAAWPSCRTPKRPSIPACPAARLEAVAVDHVLPVAEIAALLARLAAEPIDEAGSAPMPDDMEMEARIAAFDLDAIQDEDRPGQPSGFGCPDCGGSLWELQEGELIRFRCRVGHAWTANSLVAEQTEGIESALWTAPARPGGAGGALPPDRRAAQRAGTATPPPRGSRSRRARRSGGPASSGRSWSRADHRRRAGAGPTAGEAAGPGKAAPMDDTAAPDRRRSTSWPWWPPAGGLAALTAVLSALPADFPAAVVLVQHLDPQPAQPARRDPRQADAPAGPPGRRTATASAPGASSSPRPTTTWSSAPAACWR